MPSISLEVKMVLGFDFEVCWRNLWYRWFLLLIFDFRISRHSTEVFCYLGCRLLIFEFEIDELGWSRCGWQITKLSQLCSLSRLCSLGLSRLIVESISSCIDDLGLMTIVLNEKRMDGICVDWYVKAKSIGSRIMLEVEYQLSMLWERIIDGLITKPWLLISKGEGSCFESEWIKKRRIVDFCNQCFEALICVVDVDDRILVS